MIEVTVRGIRSEAQDIRSFELVAIQGGLPDWEAGAHVQVMLGGGLQRAYSLCNHAGETGCYRIAVKQEPASRGGSTAMHRLAVGDTLRISAPANHFAIDGEARRHVLLAGGIGITPLYSMANRLAADGRSGQLHVFARSPAHAVFLDRLDGWATPHFSLDAKGTASRLGEIVARHAQEPMTTFYTCGPAPFMDAVTAALDAAGVPAERRRSERFGPAPATPTAATEATDTDRCFQVRFERSGIEAEVPDGVPIIELARKLGVEIPTSCEMGVCGACLTTVLDGEPEHHDQYLTPQEQAEGRQMLPCVSRCRSGGRLVLDV